MRHGTMRCKLAVQAKRSRKASTEPERPCRAARMLALAHYIERLIGDGTIPDYAAAASALGLTRARLTQVMNLLLLAPQIQERIAMGNVILAERALRSVVKEAVWRKQSALARQMEEAW